MGNLVMVKKSGAPPPVDGGELATLPLFMPSHMSDAQYLGKFQLAGGSDDATWGDAGYGGMFYDPTGNGGLGSYWLSRHVTSLTPKYHRYGEWSIPPNLGALSTSIGDQLVPIPNFPQELEHYVLGGLKLNGKLRVSFFLYYDGGGGQGGIYKGADMHVANLGTSFNPHSPRYYRHSAGPMGYVPAGAWQNAFGKEAFMTSGGFSVIQTTSGGNSLYMFNDDDLKPDGTGSLMELMWFDQHTKFLGHENYPTQPAPDGALEGYNDAGNTLYNLSTQYFGAFIPTGFRSWVILVKIGYGLQCYGLGTTDPADTQCVINPATEEEEIYDPLSQDHGFHSYPYKLYVHAYDGLDFLRVKQGTMQIWEPRPYAIWELQGPYDGGNCGVSRGALCYDPVARKVYVGEGRVKAESMNGYPCYVMVFQHLAAS
jgi:hypothetical protein